MTAADVSRICGWIARKAESIADGTLPAPERAAYLIRVQAALLQGHFKKATP